MDPYNQEDDITGDGGRLSPVSLRSGFVSFELRFFECEGTMAGKFLLIDEAARQLGVTVDDVHRLVERKKLFPLRDGATLKFKIEEIDRFAAESGEERSGRSGLELDLELDDVPTDVLPLDATVGTTSGQTVDLELADSVVGGIPLPDATGESDSLVIGGSGSLAGSSAGDVSRGAATTGGESVFSVDPVGQNELARAMLGSSDAIGGLESMELDIDSIVGLSSPALAAAASPGGGSAVDPADSGTLDIDLSGVGGGSQPSNASGLNASGSLVFGSDVNPAAGSSPMTNAGSALSGALDSGLSLEDGDGAMEGIDLGGPIDEPMADLGPSTDLGGELFDMDLDRDGGDDESASVVGVDTASGDSSFFNDPVGESSGFTGDIPLSTDIMAHLGGGASAGMVQDTRFSAWQICGLVCCSLLLLTGGFVMFDLMRTIGSPNDLALSGPLLSPLSSVFGWR